VTVLIDSDIMMEVLRGQDEGILTKWHSLAQAETAILFSPVTGAEIWAAARAHEHVRIEQLFHPLLCAPVDCETGKLAGEFLRKFPRSHGLKTADALIAAAAIRHHAALWTHDRKRYPMQELSFYD
jgi:predicted nucleic acid-binding protein